MSDFIFSNETLEKGKLKELIQGIYYNQEPDLEEFYGDWGAFAISRNLYSGFEPYENDNHICVVIGGPVLYFRDNTFLTGSNKNEGTRAIYDRWQNEKQITWDVDLSGPFVVVLIDKRKEEIQIVTDLLSFIPVFKSKGKDNFALGTHVDTVAKVADMNNELDKVSIGDFILNGVVTYPYTIYNRIKQIKPGTVHTFNNINSSVGGKKQTYWQPDEYIACTNIEVAANDIREALMRYIERVTNSMEKVGCFISGGEDSRTILAALPDQLEKNAYIFLDEMNREGEIAKKVAEAYEAGFNINERSDSYYLDILPGASDLLGAGFEYQHSHSFGFALHRELNQYLAVFGGLLSDALIKGNQIMKKRFVKFPFVPFEKDNSISTDITNPVLKEEIIRSSIERKKVHEGRVKKIRPTSFNEWFNIWPISMDKDIANFNCNRRLIRSYEPFMANDIVKLSAIIPQDWKLNRKVFQMAVKPFLNKSKFLVHSGSGTFPYFPWYINDIVRIGKKIKKRFSNDTYQGPWTDWEKLFKSSKAKQLAKEYSQGFTKIEELFKQKGMIRLFEGDELNVSQKRGLLQVSYFLQKKNL